MAKEREVVNRDDEWGAGGGGHGQARRVDDVGLDGYRGPAPPVPELVAPGRPGWTEIDVVRELVAGVRARRTGGEGHELDALVRERADQSFHVPADPPRHGLEELTDVH